MALTLEQQRAIALGSARARMTAADPRQSADYAKERKAADARAQRVRDASLVGKSGGAFLDALGEPLPVLDEITGGLAAGGNSLVNLGRRALGRPTVDSNAVYLAQKDSINAARDERNNAHPVVAGAGSLLSGFAAAPVKGATIAAPVAAEGNKLLSFLANSAKAAGAGGGFAGAYGAADGEGLSDRLNIGASAVPEGLLAGTILHGGGALAGPVLKRAGGAAADIARAVVGKPAARAPGAREPIFSPRAPNHTERAEQAVEAITRRKGLTPESVRAAAANTYQGKPVLAAELMGREGTGQLAATARRSGATGDELEATLTQRQRAAPERIMQDFEGDLGVSPETARGDVEAMVAKGRRDARPLYEEAYAAGGIDSPNLVTLVNRPSMRRAMARAARIAEEEGREPSELGFRTVTAGAGTSSRVNADPTHFDIGGGRSVVRSGVTVEDPNIKAHSVQVENPTAQTWDYVKRGLDDVLNTYRDPISGKLRLDEEGRAILATLNKFKGEVTDLNPAYGKALEHSGDYLSTESALNRSKGMLTRGTTRDFGLAWAAAKSPSAKEAFRAGIATDIRDMANAGQLKGGKFLTPGIRQKLELAFGRAGAERFVTKMEAEAHLAKTGGRMMPGAGSPTYELGATEHDGAARLTDAARVASKFGQGRWISGSLDAVGSGVKAMLDYSKTSGLPVEVRDEFGRILQMDAEQFAEWLGGRYATPKAEVRGYIPTGAIAGQIAGRTSQ